MEINVVNIIIDSLVANGKCSIEGLGTFLIHNSKPKLSLDGTILAGPTRTVQFTDVVDDQYTLQQELLKVYPFSNEKANRVVSAFSNKVFNGLLNFDHVTLKNLGDLQSNTNGITFSISDPLAQVLKASAIDLDLKPFQEAVSVKKIAEEKHNLKSHQEAQKLQAIAMAKKEAEAKKALQELWAKEEESKKYSEQLIKEEYLTKLDIPVSNNSGENVVPDLGKYTPISGQRTDTQHNPNTFTYNKNVYEHQYSEGFWSKYLPWILLLVLLTGLAWGIRKIVSIGSEKDKVVALLDNENNDGLTEDAINLDDSANLIETVDGNNITSNQSRVEIESCIIITGVYRQQHNIDSMASLIRRAGHQVYTEPSGNYQRVGFEFDCRDADLKSFIEDVRSNIAKDAWYLVPDMEF